MASITLKSVSGADAGTVELDENIFGIEPNVPVMHQVVTAQLAARRSGTQSTKTRAEVAGGGAKPWKQKGTGRARAGSIRAPQWKGGGVALGPKPRSYAQKTPKKMIRLALRSALSDRAAEQKVIVVDDWGFETPKTKDAMTALAALGVEGRVLVVLKGDDIVTWKCFRNLPEVHLIETDQLNAYDVLCSDVVIFNRDSLPSAEGEKPKAARAPKPEPVSKPKPARAPKAEPAPAAPAASSEEADDMASDLPNRPPSDRQKTAPIKDTDRVKSAADKLDPRFEAARAKAAKEDALRARAAESKADSDAADAEAADTAAAPAEAPKKSGGFSFSNTDSPAEGTEDQS
jgi:large subunit ribosomal protein L4